MLAKCFLVVLVVTGGLLAVLVVCVFRYVVGFMV